MAGTDIDDPPKSREVIIGEGYYKAKEAPPGILVQEVRQAARELERHRAATLSVSLSPGQCSPVSASACMSGLPV